MEAAAYVRLTRQIELDLGKPRFDLLENSRRWVVFWIREAPCAFVGLAAAFAASLHSRVVVSVAPQLLHLQVFSGVLSSRLKSGNHCQMNECS